MTNTKQAETIAYNLAAINAMKAKAAVANVTGAECPKCGGGVNPKILDYFGHCMQCQNATMGR